jgi:hypothetical protein
LRNEIHGELLKLDIKVGPVYRLRLHGTAAEPAVAELEDLPPQPFEGIAAIVYL